MTTEEVQDFVNSLINGVCHLLKSEGVLFEDTNKLSANFARAKSLTRSFICDLKTSSVFCFSIGLKFSYLIKSNFLHIGTLQP